MTRTRFAIASLLQSFGVTRKIKRMTDAAYELHLMQEGEEYLGAFCWKNVEEIEDISMEYWNIRRIERERASLEEKVDEANKILHSAHTKRADVADKSKGIGQGLFNKREELFNLLETLSEERDSVMSDAQQVKRRFEALKTKARVLKDEGDTDSPAVSDNRQKLDQLREQFKNLKQDLNNIDTKVEEEQIHLDDLQAEIDHKLKGNKDEAAETFGEISAVNQDLTRYKAELGLLNEEYSKLCREIGRFLNLNAKEANCRQACKGHHGLLEQIRLLRRSIQWNKILSDRD